MIHNFKKQVEPETAVAGNELRNTVQVKRRCPPLEKKKKKKKDGSFNFPVPTVNEEMSTHSFILISLITSVEMVKLKVKYRAIFNLQVLKGTFFFSGVAGLPTPPPDESLNTAQAKEDKLAFCQRKGTYQVRS